MLLRVFSHSIVWNIRWPLALHTCKAVVYLKKFSQFAVYWHDVTLVRSENQTHCLPR